MSTFQKLRKEERETRKNLIVNAAMDLFSQKDFHKIGMRDIAKTGRHISRRDLPLLPQSG
jgi:DNA-binding transcriptional regulator YbjK